MSNKTIERNKSKRNTSKTLPKSRATASKSLEDYLKARYPVTLIPEPEGGYAVEIKDLPGCIAQGETIDEAMTNLDDARCLWIETAYKHDDIIPPPSTEIDYNGRVLVRMPQNLHSQLVENADVEGVSLNQYIVALLSQNNAVRSVSKSVEQLQQQIQKLASGSLDSPIST